ncbi:MAG: hypothetical protein ABJQ29_16525 [Luteolibacter sp.]
MRLFIPKNPLEWGELDLPLLGVDSDWHGRPLTPPLAFSLTADSENLWFVATRQSEDCAHPDASPGAFFPELWKYDTAELFLADPQSERYLEFNLAPNGAWWAAEFSSPRVLSPSQPDFRNHITTHCGDEPGHWLTALVIPLHFLKETIGFGLTTRANATFILGSPAQTFHSVAKLPGVEPDFHQPAEFPLLVPCPTP